MVALCHHLRAEKHTSLGSCKAIEDLGVTVTTGGGLGVEPKALQPRKLRLELGFEALGARAKPRYLGARALRTASRCRLGVAAMVAMERSILMQNKRDVACRATPDASTPTTVQRRGVSPPVEQDDRLPIASGTSFEPLEKRRRKRIATLTTQVDDTDRWQRRSDSGVEPKNLEPLVRLGPWRRAPEDGDGALESEALHGHASRVVARVGLVPCTSRHAPHQRRSNRGRRPEQRSPSELRPRFWRRLRRCAHGRRGAALASSPNAALPPARRSALGSVARFAASTRSRARERSRPGFAPALRRRRAGRPRSSRFRLDPRAERRHDRRMPSQSPRARHAGPR